MEMPNYDLEWNGTEWDKSAQYIYDIDEQRNALLYVEYVYGPKL